MKYPLLLGVDIGTQGTKAALFTSDGELISESFQPSELITTGVAITEDPEKMYSTVVNTIRQTVEKAGVKPSAIAGVAIDGQMAGILGIDRNFQAVTPYDSWLDSRCSEFVPVMKAHEEEIIRKTGGQVTAAHGAKILWWKEKFPEIYQKIEKFVMPSVYVTGRLCGLCSDNAFIDYTYLHFSGFSDTAAKKWDDGLLDLFDIKKEKLPKIVSPYDVVGYLTEKAAIECGLLPGTLFVAGCGDTAASSLGAGIVKKGMVYDVAGTASVFACCTDSFKPDTTKKTILYARSVIDGLYIPLAYISGGGLCLKWFSDNKGKTMKELDMLSEEIPAGSEGLYFIPHFSGRTCPSEGHIKGTFLGLDFRHTDAHLYKSMMEAVAYEYQSYFDILKQNDSGLSPTGIYGAGGGAKSRVFCQIKADVLGLAYYPLRQSDTAVFGSAMLAGFGAGISANLTESVLRGAACGEKITPKQDNTAIYRSHALQYKRILDKIGDIYLPEGE